MIRISVILSILLAALPIGANADTLRLKNGNSMSGIIKKEDPEGVELEIEIGTVKFRRSELESVERNTPPQEAELLRRQWAEKRRKESEEQRIRIRVQESERSERQVGEGKVTVDSDTGHIIANALINGKVPVRLIVDTGASVVVLSKQVGEKLTQAGVKARTSRVKQVDLTMGDGRKLKADFVILDSVRIENSTAENVEAAIMPDEQAKPGYDGVLGMSFLSRFNFGFKQKEGKLTLEKLK